MRESSQQHYRMTYRGLTERELEQAKRKAVDERAAAVRRWIDDDDEAAVRGID